MNLMGITEYHLHADLPPWQQAVLALSETDVDIEQFRLVLFDEPTPTHLPREPACASAGSDSGCLRTLPKRRRSERPRMLKEQLHDQQIASLEKKLAGEAADTRGVVFI